MFNLLNQIQSQFVSGNTAMGMQAVSLYSKLLRFALADCDNALVDANTETNFAQTLLKADNIRFDNSIKYMWPPAELNISIPGFILVHLCELAVKAWQTHGNGKIYFDLSEKGFTVKSGAGKHALSGSYTDLWQMLQQRVELYNQHNVFTSNLVWNDNGNINWIFIPPEPENEPI